MTVSGAKLTHLRIATPDEGGDVNSQAIDEQAIPILEHQARQAKRANIQSGAGASATSAGFAPSLQSARSTLAR